MNRDAIWSKLIEQRETLKEPKEQVKRCDGTPNRSRAAGHDGAVAL